MATLGSTSEPVSSQEWSGGSTNNQVGTALTFPAGGPWRVSKIGLWLAGKDGTASLRGVVWDSTRNTVLAASNAFTAASRSFGLSQNDNYEEAVSFVVNGGTTVYAGFYRSSSDNSQWGRRSGSHYDDSGAAGASPMSGAVLDTGGAIGVYLVYAADNVAPLAPTSVKLDGQAPGGVVNAADTSYLLTFTGVDPADILASYDWQIDSTSAPGVEPDWIGLAASDSGATAGISGQAVSAVITASLTHGSYYALRVRTIDRAGLVGAWSVTYFFRANPLPTISARSPGPSSFAKIWNLGTDLNVWTSGGSFAKPQVAFVYNDQGGQQSQSYRVKIWNDSSGAKGTELFDTGIVPAVVAAGATIVVNLAQAIVLGTQYWWTVEVVDSLGESSGSVDTSPATAFRVRWAQATYEFNAGSGSSGWDFVNTAPTGGDAAFLFRTATGVGGTGILSAWTPSIGSLVPAAYVNVLVRLGAVTPGTNVLLPQMQFNYIGSATTPDRMQLSGTGSSMLLDSSVRRFGTMSLKVIAGAANCRVWPYQLVGGVQVDLPVLPTVKYTLSLFVKTSGVLTSGIRLVAYQEGTTTPLLDGSTGLPVVGSLVTDSSAGSDGWQRLTLTFTVPPGAARIRPAIEYAGSAAGQAFWIDAWQLEEGILASQWRPGLSADAVLVDSGGIMVDAAAGGIFRLRGSAGGARDTVEIGTNGWLFGGDTSWYSDAAGRLLLESGPATDALLRVRPPSGRRAQFLAEVAGDSIERAMLGGDATLAGVEFGPGNANRDLRLARTAAHQATLDDTAGGAADLIVAGLVNALGGATVPDTGNNSGYTINNGGTATFSNKNSAWVKVGRLVVFMVSFTVTANGSGSTAVTVTGINLPKPANWVNIFGDRGSVGVQPLIARLSDNGTVGQITRITPVGISTTFTDQSPVTGADLLNTATYVINGAYIAAT